MKTLVINIRAELKVPDGWSLADVAEGTQALKLGDRLIDFDIAPLVGTTEGGSTTWFEADEALTTEILDKVETLTTDLSLASAGPA